MGYCIWRARSDFAQRIQHLHMGSPRRVYAACAGVRLDERWCCAPRQAKALGERVLDEPVAVFCSLPLCCAHG